MYSILPKDVDGGTFSITRPIKMIAVLAKSSLNAGLLIHEHEIVDPISTKNNSNEYVIIITLAKYLSIRKGYIARLQKKKKMNEI